MLVLLSCAKIMVDETSVEVLNPSIPFYQKEANDIAMAMSQYDIGELERELGISKELAVENFKRYEVFLSPDSVTIPAVLSYSGIVFQKLNPESFAVEHWNYAQNHLRLTSFCYGLLRPKDLIHPYRLEGRVKLPELGGKSLYSFWRERLTDQFITEIKEAGGVLCNLASAEMKRLFDWKHVENEVEVITPSFQLLKSGKRKTIVVYTKMCRGAMARFIIQNKLKTEKDLFQFNWEGFTYDPNSKPLNPSFLLYT